MSDKEGKDDEGSKLASLVVDTMVKAGVDPMTPRLGPALVIVGIMVAKAQSNEEAALAFKAACSVATKAGIVPSAEEIRTRMRSDPRALAEFMGKVLGTRIDAVAVEQAPEFHRPKRRFPWLG